MKRIQKFIVISLENICKWTRHRWCHYFATTSSRLDVKWNTNVWKSVEASNQYVDRTYLNVIENLLRHLRKKN